MIISTTALALAASFFACSGIRSGKAEQPVGRAFPAISAETLARRPVTVPESLAGKPALITVAFVQSAQREIDSWAEPFLQRYPNVQYMEVPMISGGWRPLSGWIDGGMRSGIPPERHDNVATYYGPREAYFESLGVKDTERGYAYLIDAQGVVRWMGTGMATEAARAALFAETEKLTADR